MTTPLWCLLIASFIPFVLAGIGGYLRVQQLGELDANHPRVQAYELRDVAARAYAAQQNAWEALGLFTAAVVTAHLAGADAGSSATAASLFIVARVLHAGAYIADLAPARTVVFIVALGSCIALFYLAASA